MSALETYANQARIVKGIYHMQAIQALRAYIKLTPEIELERHINMITDPEILRILIEAGIKAPLHKIVISRINQLTQQQTEVKT